MREALLDLVDILDLVFFEPFRYPDEILEIPLAERKGFVWLCGFLGASSLSVGASLLHPPFVLGSLVLLPLAIFLHFFLLRAVSQYLSFGINALAESKGRPSQGKKCSLFSQISLCVFGLFTPFAFYFYGVGWTGGFWSLLLLVIFFLCYLGLVARGVMYIYEIKFQEALSFSFRSLLQTLIFPFLFLFYLLTSVLQGVVGGL